MNDGDAALRAALRRSDVGELRAAFDRHYTAMALLLRPWAVDEDDADRMIAAVWREAIAAGASAPERGSLRPWLFSFLQPRFDEAVRAHGDGWPGGVFVPDGEPWAGHWEAFPEEWGDSVDTWLSSPEGQGVLTAYLLSAPPRDRLLLVLRDVDGWSVGEVAALTGLLPQTQQTALTWARHGLRLAIDRARPSATQDGSPSDRPSTDAAPTGGPE